MARGAAALAVGSSVRIAEVCPYDLAVPGGVQGQVRGLASYLEAEGHHVEIIGPGADGWEKLRPVVPVRANGAVARIVANPAARTLLESGLEDVDALHVHEPLMPFLSTAAMRLDVPILATLHADPAAWTRALLSAGYGRATLSRATELTAVSPVAASAVGFTTHLIPNGVDRLLYEPAEKEDGLVVFVGRDEPRKGLDVLVEAWTSVRRTAPDSRLVVISDRSGHQDGIEWLGPVPDDQRRDWLRRARVVAAPNRRGESFGMVIAEAMAAGCSVVASDLPAFRWVLDGHGRLVPVGDANALAGAIVEALAEPAGSGEIRSAAQRFSWPKVGAGYVSLLESIC